MPAGMIPALIMGGASIGSSLIGRSAANSAARAASQRSPEEIAALNAQTGLARQQTAQGSQLFGAAMPAISNTLRYYQTLLGGSRGARVAATSGEAEDIGNAYSGADAALRRSNVRGGELVQQQAENARAKAGQVARLVTGVRPQAASALTGEGMGLVSAAQGSQWQAGGIYSGLLGAGQQNRQQGNFIGLQTGSNLTGNLGRLVAQLVNQGKGSWWGKTPGASMPLLPSHNNINTNMGSLV